MERAWQELVGFDPMTPRPEGWPEGDFARLDRARAQVGILPFLAGDIRVGEVMTRGGKSIAPDRLAVEALNLMEDNQINALLVIDADGRLCGALNMHDLLRAGVV